MTDKHRLELDGYNALLKDYCERMTALEAQVDTLTADVATLTAQVVELRADVAHLSVETAPQRPLSQIIGQWYEIRADGETLRDVH